MIFDSFIFQHSKQHIPCVVAWDTKSCRHKKRLSYREISIHEMAGFVQIKAFYLHNLQPKVFKSCIVKIKYNHLFGHGYQLMKSKAQFKHYTIRIKHLMTKSFLIIHPVNFPSTVNNFMKEMC